MKEDVTANQEKRKLEMNKVDNIYRRNKEGWFYWVNPVPW